MPLSPTLRRVRFCITGAFAGACLAVLSGCMSIATMVAAAQLDPLETNPSDIRLAIIAPPHLRIADGDIALIMGFDGGEPDLKFEERYLADIARNRSGASGISTGDLAKGALSLLSLRDEDAASMRSLQARIKAIRATGIRGRGYIGFSAMGCSTQPVGGRPLPISVYFQPKPEADFTPLTRDADLIAMLRKTDDVLPRCDGQTGN